MARFLIGTIPVVGHVSPALLIARELVNRGHEVCWYTGSAFRAKVESTGAHFAPIVSGLDYSYPSSPKLGIEFAFKEKLAKTLPQLFLHRFVPSLMDLVFERKFSFLCRDFAILQRLDCRRKKVKPAVFRSQIILHCYAT